MTRDEIDALWHRALHEAVQAGEKYTRYHFAALVAAAEREECAKVCEESATPRNDTYQASYVLRDCAAAIRARGQQ